MIRSLTISGYRAFSHFEMTGLGRVNLLVGTNNSGKTSVLEALYLLASEGEPNVLWRIVSRRGEKFTSRESRHDEEYDVSHLFYNHRMMIGASFSIEMKNTSSQSVKFEIQRGGKDIENIASRPVSRIVMSITNTPYRAKRPTDVLPLTRRGGLQNSDLDDPRRLGGLNASELNPVRFISTESLSMYELLDLWNLIALTEAEERVIQALTFLEPRVQRIAPITGDVDLYYRNRGGFVVKLSDVDEPIPIGSLGDGTWRMLALAIALSGAKDGILLIDEIDTGLHYTVMASMWRLISETAKALNVQVFATTHSYDCVHSLATICEASDTEVTLQRLEINRKKSVPFTGAEIKIAAERQIEVR